MMVRPRWAPSLDASRTALPSPPSKVVIQQQRQQIGGTDVMRQSGLVPFRVPSNERRTSEAWSERASPIGKKQRSNRTVSLAR